MVEFDNDAGRQFVDRMGRDTESTPIVVAISVLIDLLSGIKSSVTTVAEVLRLLKSAIQAMQQSELADAGLESGCEIFNWLIFPMSFKAGLLTVC